jgi:hypothetical protein
MSEAYALEILETAGATKPVRDSVDTRVVEDFRNGTGRIPDSVNFPADYPVFASRSAPQDQDDDGMSDIWESENGFDPTRNDSAEDKDNDGYTNIEEYLHFLADSKTSSAPVTRPAPPTDLNAD